MRTAIATDTVIALAADVVPSIILIIINSAGRDRL